LLSLSDSVKAEYFSSNEVKYFLSNFLVRTCTFKNKKAKRLILAMKKIKEIKEEILGSFYSSLNLKSLIFNALHRNRGEN
jgi:hypothetical protein